jgi:hypothetical protein
MATAEDYAKMSDSEKKKEDWMNSKWRPMMGWLYMGTCFFDFVLFPVLWSLLQSVKGIPVTQWQPLTLQGAGLYHIAMGAVLGLAAWGRTQEKLNGANNGGIQSMGSSSPTAFGSSTTGGFGSGGFGATPTPATSNFGGSGIGGTPRQSPSFGAPAVAGTAMVGGAVAATAMPAVSRPMPSRPPIDEDMPELE